MDSHALPTHALSTNTPDDPSASPVTTPDLSAGAREWVSPGVSPRKRVLTGIGVALATVIFFVIAKSEGASSLVSTVIGIVFIAGFVGYLRVVAPIPFTLTLDAEGITRTERGAEPVTIPWPQVAKIKQELFPTGKPVSIALFKRVGERGLHRVWVVYGDDVPRFDEFVVALRAALPEGTPWLAETVHE